MALTSEWIKTAAGVSGFFARPERASASLPAVLVLQELWGVDAHIEDVARRFAGAGYGAFAPDLYAESGERPPAMSRERVAELAAFIDAAPPNALGDPAAREAALAKLPPAARGRVEETRLAVFSRIGGADKLAAFVPKLLAAVRYVRDERAETRGQAVASVGYCMGGGLSALLACHDPELGAAVIYYGSAPPADEWKKIRCPVRGFYGGKDERITSGVPAFADAMRATGKDFEPRVYPQAGHAFFNDGRPSYDAAAARDAFARTLSFLRDTVGGTSADSTT
jgi:carboxymethylenebutenolidase